MNAHWTLDDIPWHLFDASKINPEIAKLVRAAALVEYGGRHYADFLNNIFAGDPVIQADIEAWAVEEVQHGAALGKWASMADSSYNLEQRYADFRSGYSLDLSQTTSARGSRVGELIARCMVETGTSSYYTALADACDEPVLKEICRKIAADELRHYKLFYTYMQNYLTKEPLSTFNKLKIALGRIAETEDDELAFAYHVANEPQGASYNRAKSAKDYAERAYSYYQRPHLDRAIGMIFKACGLKPHTWLYKGVTQVAWWTLDYKTSTQRKAAASLSAQQNNDQHLAA